MKTHLSLEPVTSYAEAFAVALIRNECCRWMTHNNKPIAVGQQVQFYRRLIRSEKLRLFLLRIEPDGAPCGYALTKKSGYKVWLTAGIATAFRQRGFGRHVFKTLIKLCDGTKPWLEVLRTNYRAIRLYHSLGFVIRKTKPKIFVMQYDPTA